MRKLIVATLAAASVLTAASVANAGVVCNVFGCVYVPTYCTIYGCL